jgi:hypothetical protein
MKTSFTYILLGVLFLYTGPLSAQKNIKAPCWNISFINEGKTDTLTTEIYGRVYDLWGHGIAFTRVSMGPYSAVTDENGNYRIGHIVAGTYEIHLHNYCPLSARKTKIKKGKKLRMDICVTLKREEHPGLGIPDHK